MAQASHERASSRASSTEAASGGAATCATRTDISQAQKLFGNHLIGQMLDGGSDDGGAPRPDVQALLRGVGGHRSAALLRGLMGTSGFAGRVPAAQAPVQLASSGEGVSASPAEIHHAAAFGLTGVSQRLPHGERIQKAFGAHRVDHVKAIIGGPADVAGRAMGALAYATGSTVAFRHAPDLHTAAHEAAHVVQQRGGVQLKGGIGAEGDVYERHADAVADAVVAGRSAEGLLDEKALPGTRAQVTSAVQLRSMRSQEAEEDRSLRQEKRHLARMRRLGHHTKNQKQAHQDGQQASRYTRNKAQLEKSREQLSITQAEAGSSATHSILQSSNPELHGRSVNDVGADLLGRAARYRNAVSKLQKITAQQKKDEESWYRDGASILFNRRQRTDPTRWTTVTNQWDHVAALLDSTAKINVVTASINKLGDSLKEAVIAFQAASRLSAQYAEEFSAYLGGYTRSTEKFIAVTTALRDISFAAAVSVAVVAAAPVIFGGASTVATTLGLGGKATLFAGGATIVGAGGIGASLEGGGQAASALIVESTGLLDALTDKETTWQQAIDRFSWREIGGQGWDGMKRGFIDGILAYAGMGFEKVLRPGAKVLLDRLLGETGSKILAQICRHALDRAIAGGATGAVIGALDAGIKGALAGRSLREVVDAMKFGFFLGAAIGVVLGSASGVLEARAAQRHTAQSSKIAADMLARDPGEFSAEYQRIVAAMTPRQLAAFKREIAGRRFIDTEHYAPAAQEYKSGRSQTAPEHRYGENEFQDWSEAARELDARASERRPLTQADIESAHGKAGRSLTPNAGRLREVDVAAGGGVGPGGLWSKLTPSEVAVMETNPHLRLLRRGEVTLAPEEVAQGLESAIIAYPQSSTVLARLDAFFIWFRAHQQTIDPIALAARAQREFVSIHPFSDGNGRLSRLVMDYALKSRGLPPALLHDPNLDFSVSEAAWAGEVQKGVFAASETARQHVNYFNYALGTGEPRLIVARWSAILGLTSDPQRLIGWLYSNSGVTQPDVRTLPREADVSN